MWYRSVLPSIGLIVIISRVLVLCVSLIAGHVSIGSAFSTDGLKVYPIPEQQLPSNEGGCHAGTTQNGVTTIPIRVVKHRVMIEPLVNMCFSGRGPYPMLIDTGASSSVISADLAEELGLRKIGRPGRATGFGCTIRSQNVRLQSWSVGGVPLRGGEIATVDAPGKGVGHPRGSLGADVLSRFGSVRIDFKREVLMLVGPEGPPFIPPREKAPVPRQLIEGGPRLTIPMQVSSGSGISQTVQISVGSTTREQWLVDTGSALSLSDAKVVKQAGLKATGTAQRGATYCSIVTVPEYRAPSLRLLSGKLKPQIIGSFANLKRRGLGGVLGSYSLWQFGSVVFNWAGRQLLLGSEHSKGRRDVATRKNVGDTSSVLHLIARTSQSLQQRVSG